MFLGQWKTPQLLRICLHYCILINVKSASNINHDFWKKNELHEICS